MPRPFGATTRKYISPCSSSPKLKTGFFGSGIGRLAVTRFAFSSYFSAQTFPSGTDPAAYDSPAYKEALRALGNGAERDIRIVEGA